MGAAHERDVASTGAMLIALVNARYSPDDIFTRGQELLDIDDAAEAQVRHERARMLLPASSRAMAARMHLIRAAIAAEVDPDPWRTDASLADLTELSAVLGRTEVALFEALDEGRRP